MDIARVQSLLEQAKPAAGGAAENGGKSPVQAFADLLQESSDRQNQAAQAAEQFLTAGEGELHQVQMQMAKADITFRFLLEVRNKLTEAYQEVARLQV